MSAVKCNTSCHAGNPDANLYCVQWCLELIRESNCRSSLILPQAAAGKFIGPEP